MNSAWKAFNDLLDLAAERRKRRKNIEVTFDDSLKRTAIILNQAIDELNDEEKHCFLISLIGVLKAGGDPSLSSVINNLPWPLIVITNGQNLKMMNPGDARIVLFRAQGCEKDIANLARSLRETCKL